MSSSSRIRANSPAAASSEESGGSPASLDHVGIVECGGWHVRKTTAERQTEQLIGAAPMLPPAPAVAAELASVWCTDTACAGLVGRTTQLAIRCVRAHLATQL